MSLKDWKYYNHAIIPAVEPHEKPDLSCIKDRTIWKVGGIPFLARWTTDYDCGCETSWWYVIKDTPFNIATLKAKRRYEINKGKKNFEVRRINPSEYVEDYIMYRRMHLNHGLKNIVLLYRKKLLKKM